MFIHSSKLSKLIYAVLLLCCISTMPNAIGAVPSTIDIVTEEFPPYNFTKDGKITGYSTEVVQAVLKEIGINGNIAMQPWARALDSAQGAENVLIYSISRSEQREKLFKWVGQINESKNRFYALKGSPIKIGTLEEAMRYKTGTVNGDVREQYLEKRGFVIGSQLSLIHI